jgi:MFS family permease
MYVPLAVTLAVVVVVGGPLTTWFGYYNPVLIIGGTFAAVGAGLLTTLELDTSIGKWISYQIIYGIGIGLAFQPPYLAVQTILAESDVPTALVMLSYAQQFGGIVMLAIAQNVFLNRLSHNLSRVHGLDVDAVGDGGALGIIQSAPAHLREQVLMAYNGALKDVFYIPLGLSCLVAVCMCGLEWRSMKKPKKDEANETERTFNN